MRTLGVAPSVSADHARGVGGTANSLLTAYGLMFSNPKVHKYKVELESPFLPFVVPWPLTPRMVEAEVLKNLAYARRSADSRVSYNTIRLWFSESDKPPDPAAIWHELGFMRGTTSMLLAFGNENRIQQILHVPATYSRALTSVISSKMPHSQFEADLKGKILAGLGDHLRKLPSGLHHALLDVFLPPPFFRRLGTPGKGSPFNLVFAALRSIPPPAIGVVRVLFCATTQPWGPLMGELIDYEERTLALGHVPKEVLQAAREKAAGAPAYAASLWIAAFADKSALEPILHSLSAGFQSLRYGGRELGFLTEHDYGKLAKSRKGFVGALLSPHSYRVGSLFTPAELGHCWAFPSQDILQNDDYSLLKTTATRRPRKVTEPGLKLGFTTYAGTKVPVLQPARIRSQATAVIGKPGKGKSVGLGMWALEMADAGIGFAIIESHRCLVPWLLERLPGKHWPKVIYIDPTDIDHVLRFNILELEPGQDVGKVADDRVSALRAQYTRTSWGPEIQRHMDCLIQTGLSVPGMRIADLPALYEKNYQAEKVRDRALVHVENPELVRYWTEIYPNTSKDQLARVLSKITPFLRKEMVARMMHEPTNTLNFRDIMDSGKILLADIPAGLIGSESCNLLCSTFASFFYNAALSRQDIPEKDRIEYCLLMDEYQRITTRDSEDALRESRKHRLSISVAFQQESQMPETVRTALANAGTLIAFDTGLTDAKELFSSFYGEVPMKTLMHKGERQAVCLMDGEIVSLSTYPAPKPLRRNYIREIRENSREHYYVHRSKAEYYKAVRQNRAEHKKLRGPRKPVYGQYDEVSE